MCRDTVDNKAKEFIRELLLNPRRLFEWWEEQHEQEIAEGGELNAQIASMQKRIEQMTQKYHRTLDRLTDSLDGDEIAYYSQQRDSFKQLLVEYREELERSQAKDGLGKAREEIVQDFISMGNEYRVVLETSEDFAFWRGLVEDLDITAIPGDDGARRWIEFIVFGKTRRRFYLITEPLQDVGEQGKIDFSRRSRSSGPYSEPRIPN